MGKRILIAGFEIGGQMALIAETFRQKGIKCHSVAFNQDFRNYTNDFSLTRKGIRGIADKAVFWANSIRNYDIFYFFWGKSFLDTNRFPNLDLPLLKKMGKKILVHYRGSDLMNIEYYHCLRSAALGNDASSLRTQRQTRKQIERVNWCSRWVDHVLVSTPNLLDLVPKHAKPKLFPQVIDTQLWVPSRSTGNKDKIVIAHAPTRRFVKGTDLIIQAIENLRDKGLNLELRLIENTPFSSIKTILEEADFGIDQLFSGWYGKIAVEMMALGKPVFCFINQEYEQIANVSPPVVRTTAISLEQDIKDFINRREDWETIGNQGRQFVEIYHDVVKEADRILQLVDD